jgi:type II secretory pathway predicted ATPase ExeA
MIDELKKSRMMVSESMSMEKERVNLTSLVNALYMDFGEKPEKDRESRDRKLFQMIEKHSRRVVLFVDDAHNLPNKTLFGLKALVEKGLCVVLVGHPRLAFNLKRGVMEEIGMRCECLELQGLAGETSSYLKWLIEEAKGGSKSSLRKRKKRSSNCAVRRCRCSASPGRRSSKDTWRARSKFRARRSSTSLCLISAICGRS